MVHCLHPNLCSSAGYFGTVWASRFVPLVPPEETSSVALADRIWFELHPHERVRFRPERRGEFSAVEAAGHTVPAFAPPQLSASIPLTWVAVVELTRLLVIEDQPNASTLRIRFRTAPIRSRAMQQRLAPVYEAAVVQDFLRHHPTLSVTTAA